MAPTTRSVTRVEAQARQQAANVAAAAQRDNRAVTRSMTRQARMAQQAANIAGVTNAIQVFRLMDLPLELVDAVFRHALDAGDAAITRTSSIVYGRSKSFLPTNGVLHIRAQEARDVGFRVQPILLTSQIAAMAMHVHIVLKLTAKNKRRARNFGCLPNFVGAHPRRESCHIVLSSSHTNIELRTVKPINLLWAFKDLVGFETVAVEIFFNGLPEGNATRAMLRGPLLMVRNRPLYETFRRELEPTLGPAEWRYADVQGGWYLEFCPRRYAESLLPVVVEEVEESPW